MIEKTILVEHEQKAVSRPTNERGWLVVTFQPRLGPVPRVPDAWSATRKLRVYFRIARDSGGPFSLQGELSLNVRTRSRLTARRIYS
jgi:hypothetical protein